MPRKEFNYDYFAGKMRKRAMSGVFSGKTTLVDQAYMARCRRIIEGTTLIFTRDVGHHVSGWFKNPDYERCFHLSMSPAPSYVITLDTPELDRRVRDSWLRAFFRDDLRYVWAESPKSREGRAVNVWHWRLFCDPSWKALMPRGEVYTKMFTELGWKTASELGVEIVSTVDPS